MRKIGDVIVDKNNIILYVDREAYGQGYIFKDEEAFYNRPDSPCYVSEYQKEGDEAWTYNAFLDLANGHKKVAEYLFQTVDWQSPITLLDEELEYFIDEYDMTEEEAIEAYAKTF